MLDRGERLDWFDATEIVIEACLAGLGLYLFAVHSLMAQKPFLDPKLLLDHFNKQKAEAKELKQRVRDVLDPDFSLGRAA